MKEVEVNRVFVNEDGVTVMELSEDSIDESSSLTWEEQIAYRDYMHDLQIDINDDD